MLANLVRYWARNQDKMCIWSLGFFSLHSLSLGALVGSHCIMLPHPHSHTLPGPYFKLALWTQQSKLLESLPSQIGSLPFIFPHVQWHSHSHTAFSGSFTSCHQCFTETWWFLFHGVLQICSSSYSNTIIFQEVQPQADSPFSECEMYFYYFNKYYILC